MGVGSFMTQLFQAGQAGWAAARRVFDDPAQSQYRGFYTRINEYNLLWSYYNNSAFDAVARFVNGAAVSSISGRVLWDQYKANYNLYRNIRLIYNPTEGLVDFYASQVYPGVLSRDGLKLPDGVPLAIPFTDDTKPILKTAIAQIWQWSNWQAKKALEIRYCAALGSVLVEVIDDLEHGKVTLDVTWPGKVCDLILDAAGNVKKYAIEYYAYDQQYGGQYLYKKTVDQEKIQYFKDNQLFDYGNGSTIENVYGFVPAVWIKHSDLGGDHGAPAIKGSMGPIDELNNLVSHTHDQIHKVIGAPILIGSSSKITSLFSTQKRGPTNEMAEPTADQEGLLMLGGPADANVSSLAGNLDLVGTGAQIDRLLLQIEKRHPELTFYEQLRTMSQVTGPGASRMMGDVEKRVIDAQATYDTANISLFRMAVAIAGMRASSGAWGPLNSQQAKFKPFDLNSYERGDLEMEIAPRPLLTSTKLEDAQEKQAVWTGVQLAASAGVPLKFALAEAGFTDDELKTFDDDLVTKIANDQAAAQEDQIPEHAQ